jgi:hypothetical protein
MLFLPPPCLTAPVGRREDYPYLQRMKGLPPMGLAWLLPCQGTPCCAWVSNSAVTVCFCYCVPLMTMLNPLAPHRHWASIVPSDEERILRKGSRITMRTCISSPRQLVSSTALHSYVSPCCATQVFLWLTSARLLQTAVGNYPDCIVCNRRH